MKSWRRLRVRRDHQIVGCQIVARTPRQAAVQQTGIWPMLVRLSYRQAWRGGSSFFDAQPAVSAVRQAMLAGRNEKVYPATALYRTLGGAAP